MKYFVMIAAASATLAVPAQAQDFSGFRVEGRAAWEQLDAEATIPNPDFDEDEEDSDEFLVASDDDSGVSYGLELGYDAQIGSSIVIGGYGGVDFSDSGNCAELIADDLACAGLERTFTAGVRAGVPLGGSVLVYAKGGYSNGDFDASYDADVTDNDDDQPGAIERFSEKRDGYHVGGGVEVALMRGIYGKLEYVYTDFGSTSYLLGEGDADSPALEVGSSRHQVFAGIGLRF